MTCIIQMDLVQLNIGSNPCTTPKHLCYFSYLHSRHCPFHFFYHFYLVIKAPSLQSKSSNRAGPGSRGLQCKYTKPWDERAQSHSRTGVPLHYTSSSICICISISTVYKSFSICVFTLSEWVSAHQQHLLP